MMDIADRVRENRVRRVAQRRGLRIVKSRRRDPRALDYGCYCIVDADTNCVVAGGGQKHFHWSLDDVEKWLTE